LKTQLSDYVLTDSVIELSIPFNEISLGNIASIGTGITIYTESGKLFLPFQGKPLAVYNRILPTGSPTGFNLAASSVDPASKIIIRWNKCSDCNGHIIEKLDEEQGSFKILTELDYKGYQYIDDNLENHKEYSYRMYSYNPAGRSGYSATLTGFTHDVGIAEQDQNERFQVLMDPASGSLILRITDPDLIVTSVALYDFSGRQVYNSSCKKTGNELTLPLHDVSPGLYLLLLNCDNARYSERVLIY
jgi:hypothetical protein